MKFRKKPIVIEAFQMTSESRMSNVDWPEWMHRAWQHERETPGSLYPTERGTGDGTLSVGTLEGPHLVSMGDWIIRGVKGELYPCKPDIFKATYEPADLQAAEYQYACPQCEECGKIANSEEGEPWTVWLKMPLGSAQAVVLGLVKPIECPGCGGSGWTT